MSIKNKAPKISNKRQGAKIPKQISQNPDIELVKKIASISERAERYRASLIPQQTKFYKL